MMRDGEFESAEFKLVASSKVHIVSRLDALFIQPEGDLMIRNHGRSGAFGNLNSIPNVITMAMGDHDVVGLNLICRCCRDGISCQKGINQNILPGDLQ